MKNLKLSLIAFCVIGNFSYAGGDISPVTDYEIEDAVVADEEAYPIENTYNEPIEEETVIDEFAIPEPQPKIVTPAPIPVAVKPIPIKRPVAIAKKKIYANGFYAGLGITSARYKDSCQCEKNVKVTNRDTTYGVMGRVGYDFNQYIGVEARGLKTNWDSDGSRVEHIGVYLKPMMPITNNANVYGLVGVGNTKVKGNMPDVDSDALALGGGIEVDLSKDTPRDGRYSRNFDGQGDQEKGVGVFVDYERLVVKKDAPILDAVSAGVSYDF